MNFGWTPSFYTDLPYNERLVILNFIFRDLETRQKERKEVEKVGNNK